MKNVIWKSLLLAIVLLSWSACAAQRELSSTSNTDSVQVKRSNISDSIIVQRIRWIQQTNDTVFVRDTILKERYKIKEYTDTVYCTQQIERQLPPVRYIPRFYKIMTCIALLLILASIIMVALKVKAIFT